MVRSFLESPLSVQFVRDITKFLGAYQFQPSKISNLATRVPIHQVRKHEIPPILGNPTFLQEEPNQADDIILPLFNSEIISSQVSQPHDNESDWRMNNISSLNQKNIPHFEQPETKEISSTQKKNKYCQFPGCSIQASFNWKGFKRGIFCLAHRVPGMSNVSSMTCLHEGCTIQPKFNFAGKVRRYCFTHKLEGMINVKPFIYRCENSQCDRVPTFNFPGIKRGRFCASHKLEGMIARCGRVYSSSRCKAEGCTNKPQFSEKGKRPKFCSEHKLTNMVLTTLTRKKCRHPTCRKVPLFNFRRMRNPKFCHEHKLEGMVKVTTPSCISPGCNRNANYGYMEDETTPKHCSVHKLEGMIRLGVSCFHSECKKTPSFNFEGESYGKYCSEHKQSDMVRVVARGVGNRCAHPCCTEETKGKFCLAHKGIKRKQPLCRHASCNNPPEFGYTTGRKAARFCSIHKQEGMVVVQREKITPREKICLI